MQEEDVHRMENFQGDILMMTAQATELVQAIKAKLKTEFDNA